MDYLVRLLERGSDRLFDEQVHPAAQSGKRYHRVYGRRNGDHRGFNGGEKLVERREAANRQLVADPPRTIRIGIVDPHQLDVGQLA